MILPIKKVDLSIAVITGGYTLKVIKIDLEKRHFLCGDDSSNSIPYLAGSLSVTQLERRYIYLYIIVKHKNLLREMKIELSDNSDVNL